MLNPFALVSSDHGPLIVSVLDNGVSERVFATGTHELWNINIVKDVATIKRQERGNGITVVDVGANIGVNTVAWAKHLRGWGQVIAFEPQERVFYALAGNIALNNCYNATALFAAVGQQQGVLSIPRPDYLRPANLGGMSAFPNLMEEKIKEWADVMMVTLDSVGLARPDIVKVDVEGMELDVLKGMPQIITTRPVLVIEPRYCSLEEVVNFLPDYECWPMDQVNIIAWHKEDPSADQMRALIHDYRINQLGTE